MNKSIAQIAEELGVTRQAVYKKLKDEKLKQSLEPFTIKQGNLNLYSEEGQKLIKQEFVSNEVDTLETQLTEKQLEIESYETQLSDMKQKVERYEIELSERQLKVESLETELSNLKSECAYLKAEKDNISQELKSKDNIIQELNNSKQELQASLQSQIDRLKEEVHSFQLSNTELKAKYNSCDELVKRLEADKNKLNERLDKAETNISNLTASLAAAQALHGMDKQQAVIEVKADDATAPEAVPPAEIVSDADAVQEEPQQHDTFLSRLFSKLKKKT